MSKKITDLTGQKFERLTVIGFSHTDKRRSFWNCICECGNKTIVNRNNLVSKQIKSCGCLKIEKIKKAHTLPNNQAYWNHIYYTYKRSAKKRNYFFELSIEEVKELCLGECYYCGRPATGADRNGIDRVDNEEGYTINNVVSCCARCNTMKLDISTPDFLSHIQNILKHQNELKEN